MVNLLGATLPDRKLVSIAIQSFYGINSHLSSLIMARLQFHSQLKVQDLSESQLNSLSALLSAPNAFPKLETPTKPFFPSPPSSSSSDPSSSSTNQVSDVQQGKKKCLLNLEKVQDPVKNMVIEEDLRRRIRADIAHHRTVGTLKGRQHAMGLPVRGQRNSTNAKTAKKLNRIERRGFATSARETSADLSSSTSSSSVVLSELQRLGTR